MYRWLEALRKNVSRPDIGFDLLRIFLGAALFARGVLFIAQPSRVLNVAGPMGEWFWPVAIAHFVGIAHLCGGLLLALGLATRLAAVVQIPVLFGAVFFVHWKSGLLAQGQSLELSALVLAMLVAYAIFGAGTLSFDHLIHREEAARARASGRKPTFVQRRV